jgi:multimeric flavodoxin WrbA
MTNLRVVGIVASPRKGMNTDTLATKVLEGAKSAGAETEKIYSKRLFKSEHRWDGDSEIHLTVPPRQ